MKRFLFVFASVLFVFFSCQGFAAPIFSTLTGSTGLVKMPTAQILNSRDWNVGIDYIFDTSSGSQIANLTDLRGSWTYKFNIGADMGHDKGMEIGFIGKTEKVTNRFKEGVFINMKYAMKSSDDPDALSLALGIENLTSSSESDAYIVASKFWGNGLGLHFGAMFDFPNYNKFRPLGMLGVNAPVGDKNLNLMGEVFAGESVFQVDAGISYTFSRAFSVIVRGVNVTNNISARDNQSYTAGVCLTSPF